MIDMTELKSNKTSKENDLDPLLDFISINNIKKENCSSDLNKVTNKENEETEKKMINEKEAMKRAKLGTTFLRVSRKIAVVKPRHFEITEDEDALIWYSLHKSITRTFISFSNLSALLIGQHDRKFEGLSQCLKSDVMKRQSFTVEVIKFITNNEIL